MQKPTNGAKEKFLQNLRLDVIQIISVFYIVTKLCIRRFLFNAVIFAVPVSSLAILWVVKIVNGYYVIPLANDVLQNSPGGNERFVNPKGIFSYQKYINQYKQEIGTDVSPKILYSFGDSMGGLPYKNDYGLRDFVKNITRMTNISGTSFLQEYSGDVELELYSRINSELINPNQDYNDVFGVYQFHTLNNTHLIYGIQNEQKMERYSPAEVPTLVRRILSNHSDATMFCTLLGGLLESYECDIFVFNMMKQLVNSQFIYRQTGRLVQSSVSHIPYSSKGKQIENLKHEMICLSMIPMMCIICIVYFVNHIVWDKENKSREMMKVMGLKEKNYFFVLWVFFSAYNFVYFSLYYLFGRFVFQFRFFTQISTPLFFVVFLVISYICISFSFLVSAFFKGSFNATFFTFSFVISFSQSLSNGIDSFDKSPFYMKWVDFLFPCNVCHLISRLKFPAVVDKVFLNLDYLWKDQELLHTVLLSMFISVIYFGLYMYLERVIPQPYGVRKKWYYPLKWFIQLIKKKNLNRNKCENNENEDLDKYGISVRNMWKKYGKIEAVRGVTYDVRKNEIFGLFGPNGCGKTSSINAFVGIHDVSDGDVYICGENINTNLKSVRQKIGICPQHSVLWKELSIKDHLRFYSGMRGMSIFGKKLNRSIDEIMTQTKLKEEEKGDEETKKTVFQKFVDWFFARDKIGVKSMSTQRKLSLAISLIGDCSVIILDEPTVGISQKQKKEIWEIIKNIKNENRSILLTTHCMHTGEYLCDRICIMSKGEVKCIGTPSELKNEHGKGHVLSIHHDGRSIQKLLDFVNNNIESGDRKLIKKVGTTLQWEYRLKKVSKFGEDLLKKQKELGVIDWSVKLTSLEDVFVSVSRESDGEVQLNNLTMSLQDISKVNSANQTGYEEYERHWEEIQYEKKNFKLFLHQTFAMVRSQLNLSLRLWVGWLLQIAFSVIMVLAMVASQKYGGRADDPIVTRSFKRIVPFNSIRCQDWGNEPCYNLVYAHNNNEFAKTVMDDVLSGENNYKEFESDEEMLLWMKDNPNRTTVSVSFDSATELPSAELFKEGDFTVTIPSVDFTKYHIRFNSTSPTFIHGDAVIYAKELSLSIDNSILKIETGVTENSILVYEKNYPRVPFPHQYHEYDGYHQVGSVAYNASGLFVIIFVFYMINLQKEKKWIKYLRFMGMRISPIFISFLVLFIMLCVLYVVLTYFTSYILMIPIFTKSSFIIPVTAMFMNSVSFYCLAMVCNIKVNSKSGFWAFCLLAGIGSYFFFLVLDTTAIYGIFQNSSWFFKYFVFPILFFPFNFSKIFSDITNKTLPIFNFEKRIFESNIGFSLKSLLEINKIEVLGLISPPTLLSYLYMGLNSLFYLMLYFIINVIRERRNLFCFKNPTLIIKKKNNLNDVKIGETSNSQICTSTELVKNYFLKKVLKNINLEVFKGDAISIVGENKVGKTTLLEVLIGWTEKTSGNLKVFGKTPNLNHGIDIGYLPQESFLLNLFSGRQIVELCSIAKGLKWSCIPRHIIKLFVDVDLLGSENKAVKSYSGGMMRRLAAALSLIGFPKMLVLDEMSRGIDPISKQKIWNLVAKNNTEKGTTVLFSTHEIDTATEILGTKIAFLVDGKIQKFETTNKLKKDYTKGFVIKVHPKLESTVNNNKEELIRFIDDKILSGKKAGTRVDNSGSSGGVVEFDIKDIDLPKTLDVLEKYSNRGKYECFEVSQICLQDIYEKFVFNNKGSSKKIDIDSSRSHPSESDSIQVSTDASDYDLSTTSIESGSSSSSVVETTESGTSSRSEYTIESDNESDFSSYSSFSGE